MNYDIDEMERIIADNLATHFVKNYSINKSDIDTHYALGEIIYNEKINTAEKIKERASELSSRIGTIKDADQIIVLDEGRIVGKGTHQELISSCKIYQEIASSQLKGDVIHE